MIFFLNFLGIFVVCFCLMFQFSIAKHRIVSKSIQTDIDLGNFAERLTKIHNTIVGLNQVMKNTEAACVAGLIVPPAAAAARKAYKGLLASQKILLQSLRLYIAGHRIEYKIEAQWPTRRKLSPCGEKGPLTWKANSGSLYSVRTRSMEPLSLRLKWEENESASLRWNIRGGFRCRNRNMSDKIDWYFHHEEVGLL